MISWKTAIGTALCDFVEQHTGTRPDLKPSRKAHLASGSFLRGDAEAAAQALSSHVTDCGLLGAPLLARVGAENGWLLLYLTADATDAKTPDDPVLLDGFYAMLFSAPRGEERFFAAPRAHDGMERVALEQRLSRMATILLWERRKPV